MRSKCMILVSNCATKYINFFRQLSLERDKLRLSLDREVAMSKRLSLENEELAWRLNSFQNSPTSPNMSTDRFNWKLSGLNSPDSAVYSQKIEESDFEYQINDTKVSKIFVEDEDHVSCTK